MKVFCSIKLTLSICCNGVLSDGSLLSGHTGDAKSVITLLCLGICPLAHLKKKKNFNKKIKFESYCAIHLLTLLKSVLTIMNKIKLELACLSLK